ncbi:MAG: MFS transporter, partial [Bacteroidota bacterium]
EGLTFVLTSFIVGALGWQMGFIVPGMIAMGVAFILFLTLQDRPQTYGLPHVTDYTNDYTAGKPSTKPTWELQKEILKSRVVWQIGLAAALLYTARYAIHSWGPFYFQEAKGFSMEEAGWLMGLNTMFGLLGAMSSGFVSDKVFKSKRNIPTAIYGSLLIAGLVIMFAAPPGHVWIDAVGLGLFEFALGGSLVFLAGLIAVDVFSKKATGAVKGVIGLFSYVGAATQDWVSGVLIDSGKTIENGIETYDFTYAFYFWIGAAVLSLIAALSVWNVKSKA